MKLLLRLATVALIGWVGTDQCAAQWSRSNVGRVNALEDLDGDDALNDLGSDELDMPAPSAPKIMESPKKSRDSVMSDRLRAAESAELQEEEIPPMDVSGDGYQYGHEPPAPVVSSGTWYNSGLWYTSADLIVFRRSRPRAPDRDLLGGDISTGRGFFNYSVAPGVEASARVTVGQFLGRDAQNRDISAEFTYLGMGEFVADDGIQAGLPRFLFLAADPDLNGFSASDIYTTQQTSSFQSFELNARIRRRLEKDRLVMAPNGTWTQQYTRGFIPSVIDG
ncbi:MAG: hypothetical protein SGJ20_03185, partial [Planctomycetota bacterium]|nr:hypothetical protein [Planctomycetota bacterium]